MMFKMVKRFKCKLFGHRIFRVDWGSKRGETQSCKCCDYEKVLGTYFTPQGGNQPVQEDKDV